MGRTGKGMPRITGGTAFVPLVVASLIAAALAACSGPSPATPSGVPATSTTLVVTAVRTPSGQTAFGGTLRLASREAPAHFDVHFDASPALSTWGPGIVYSRLMRVTSGHDVTLPSLAVECELCRRWTMEDERTFLFELREEVRWGVEGVVQGRALDANDIVFSYGRQRGADAPNRGLLAAVDAVEAVGLGAVRITLAVPDADVLLGLADARSKVVAPEAVAVHGDLREGPVIGTGPWRLINADAFAFRFERNDGYFEEGLPYAAGLEISVIPDEANRDAAFRVGLVDVMDMEPQAWLDFQAARPNAPMLAVQEQGVGMELALNASREPFDDPALRRAVFQAHDPWRAVGDMWLGMAYVGPGFPVAGASWLLTREELQSYFNRPGLARAAVEAAGGAARTPVTIRVGNYGQAYIGHAERLGEELRAVGLDVDVELVSRRLFGEVVWLGGDYQVLLGPTPPVTTPNAYLLNVLHSGGVWNRSGVADAEMDRLIEAQAGEYDPARRRALVLDIQRRTLELGVRYMPATRVSVWTWQPWISEFHPNFAGFEYSHWARVRITGQP
ncbi:MAG: ABC transporter substrate-binding protein [SAR202 cluster bacterium]|nr:ABC transporter substrate-binding protein [SAR202 cluster bacterium]